MAFLDAALSRHPEALALDDGRETWSFQDLHADASVLARRLLALGLEQGEVVAIRGPMGSQLVRTLHGIWLAGGAAAVLPPRAPAEEEARALGSFAPAVLLLVGEGHPGRADRSRGPREVRTVGWHRAGVVPALEAVDPVSGDPPGLGDLSEEGGGTLARPAAVLLTSGTSGSGKTVTLSAGNLLASARAVRERLELRSTDRWFASLSPAHVGGLAMVTRAALLGSALVVRGPYRVSTLEELLREGAVTHASLVPTMLQQLLEVWGGRGAPRSLRCLLIGGAPAPEPLIRRALAAGFPLALTYGLTEAGSQVATAPPEAVRRDPRSVGRPLSGTEVRVASDGEILVRGATVAQDEVDQEGWLHTGDLGEVDPSGRLSLKGRLSDRIITGGEKVDPSEVEALLLAVPGVAEAAVVGVPDAKWGERVVAAVAVHRHGTPTEGELEALARSSFSPAKRPRSFVFLDALPKNPNGKVDRDALRRLFQAS